MAETKSRASADAVNAEQRAIAETMDEEKQQERVIDESPKQRRIEDMIESAKNKRAQSTEPERDDSTKTAPITGGEPTAE